MMASNFSAQVADWVKNNKQAAEDIFHTAANRVVDVMQTPRGQGGNMPVVTGFLWHSLVASSEAMPQLRADYKGTPGVAYSYDSGPVALVINNTPLGGKVYTGYTAVYAAKVNYSGALFVEQAAQQWPAIVKAVEAELASRLS